MESETMLKPCPFCGSQAEEGTDQKWGSFVFCTDEERCNALQHGFSSEAVAIERWNTRTEPSTITEEGRQRLAELSSTEVVSVRLGDTPDWVWAPIETAPHDYYVELLYDMVSGLTPVVGIYRNGPFWGREVEGWFATERISENGLPGHGMWIDGLIKGWRPYRYHLETAALAASGHTALLSQIGVLKHDVREVAERLSIEGLLGGQSFSEVNSLRAKMDDCARTLFKALAALSRPLP